MNKSLIFLLRRLGFYCLAGWAALTFNFFIPRMMPGDPAAIMFAQFKGKLKPEAMNALRETFGLTDEPLLSQYFTYLKHLLQGDLGVSIAYFPQPVTSVISTALMWTIFLAGSALVISFVAGTALGIIAAWKRGGKLDSTLPPVMSLIGAFPYFWLAMLALYIFGFELGWFPLRHAYNDNLSPGWSLTFLFSVIYHSFLPALTMVAVSMGGWMLSMRNTMISTLGADYITFARLKGLKPKTIMLKYVARNAILPNFTSFGMALGFVLSGALLTEIVFSYPGQGYLLLEAVRAQDFPLMQGLFMTITLAVLGANWLVDIIILILDPRTRK